MVHILCWNAPSTKLQLKERVQQDFRRPVIFIIRLYCTWATDQRVSKFHRVVRINFFLFCLMWRFPSLPLDFTVLHNDPATPQDHCGRWRIRTRSPLFLLPWSDTLRSQIFELKVLITQRILNQNRKFYNLLVTGSGRFELRKRLQVDNLVGLSLSKKHLSYTETV